MNVALYGLAIHGVGCVIPTPLDQAMQETNARPVFVNEKVLPMFGPIGPFSQTQVVTLSMVASDANLGDELQVRLFELTNGMLVTQGGSQTMHYPSVPDPNPDNATFRYVPVDVGLCANRLSGSTHFIYAVVADRKFVGASTMPDGGLSDTNHWDVTCM